MLVDDRSSKYCIVGAGSSGLAACKALAEAGVPYDCLEREDDVGGNWYYGRPNSRVYASTHTISSKRLTEYVDYPMPDDFPEYPHHTQVWEYLRGYARRFGLYERIEFGCGVMRIERGTRNSELGTADASGGSATAAPTSDFRLPTSPWLVTLADGSTRRYRGVVIANGHNWSPRRPQFPGSFGGRVMHSAEYKTPDVFTGRRVVIVGAGNTGCDIAVEAAQHAARAVISVRRGYHFLPKFWRGLPIDFLNERLHRWRVPLAVRRTLAAYIQRIVFGKPGTWLPKPDHRLFETHPIINSQLHYYLAHGRIAVRPDVAELCDEGVRFTDGTFEPADLIVYATGYDIAFPFIDRELLNWRDGKPRLFLNVFHPTCDDLFVVGLIQPDSGQFGLVDYQARLVVKFIAAADAGTVAAERLRRLKAEPDVDLSAGVRYVNSPRHLLEVEHYSYRERLLRLLADLA